MHGIFAVEPAAINNWSDLKYIVEKFGYSKGLLIAQYPKRWMALVIDACRANGAGDMDLKRIEEKLSQIKKDRLYRLGLDYDCTATWRENSTSQELIVFFDAILVRDEPAHYKMHTVNDVDESLFDNRRDKKIDRNALSLASAARCLINGCNYVILIDPYFKPSASCLKVLSSILDLCASYAKAGVEVVIHSAYKKCEISEAQYRAESKRALAPYRGLNSIIRVVRWTDDELGFDLHARYLLTDFGGMSYDRGFVEPADLAQRAMKTYVVCMDEQRKTEIFDQFSGYEANACVVDTFQLN